MTKKNLLINTAVSLRPCDLKGDIYHGTKHPHHY